MCSSVTQRDRVWAAALDRRGRFKVAQIRRDLVIEDPSDAPSSETIRRTLSAMAELGVLEHKEGSPYWRVAERR